jgi:hypothetical protein
MPRHLRALTTLLIVPIAFADPAQAAPASEPPPRTIALTIDDVIGDPTFGAGLHPGGRPVAAARDQQGQSQ